jgi:hypothetical protein
VRVREDAAVTKMFDQFRHSRSLNLLDLDQSFRHHPRCLPVLVLENAHGQFPQLPWHTKVDLLQVKGEPGPQHSIGGQSPGLYNVRSRAAYRLRPL